MDLPVKNRELTKFFSCFKPVTSGEGAVKQALSDDESGRKKKKVRRSFSRAVKAMVFQTSLVTWLNSLFFALLILCKFSLLQEIRSWIV